MADSTHHDLLFRNALLLDGTGGPPMTGDLAVSGGRIAAMGDLSGDRAEETVDAAGLALAPGFIDVHTHDDRAVLAGPDMTNKVSQGVTTVVAGNCGVSLAPYDSPKAPPPPMNLLGSPRDYAYQTAEHYFQAFEARPAAVNVALLVGHTTLRACAMDALDRPATAGEIDEMGSRLEAALEAGCIGLSSGLDYPPAQAAPTEEVIALASRAAPYGALYTTHMRNEGDEVLEAIEETVRTGRAAGLRTVISHHKCAGKRNHGRSRETLARIADAQKTMTLDLDVYPYIASSTVLIPRFLDRDPDRVLVTWSDSHPEMSGRDLAEIAEAWSLSEAEAAEKLAPAGAIYFQMADDDLERIMAFPGAMIGSDGLPHDRHPHPRLWGTFPRVLGRYVREQKLMSLAEAVHRMTGKSAEVFGFAERGLLRQGYIADLVLFDPETVIDKADFATPAEPADGILQVLVAGTAVWRDGATTGARPGHVLRRGQPS